MIRNAMTVDVEDYFHVSGFERQIRREDWPNFESRVERNTFRLMELLAVFDVCATFFVLGWVAERFPRLVKAIDRAGHEIACHGYNHQLLYRFTRAEFLQDLLRAKGLLEDLTGRPIIGYRAPSFSVTADSLWALDVLTEANFRYDSSIFPIRRDRYGIPNSPRAPHVIRNGANGINLVEFPPSTVRVLGLSVPVGGGGYLRLFPPRLVHWAIRRLNVLERIPAIVYIHPWELDPDQPRLGGPWFSRFRHYVNLDKTAERLRGLLSEFRFCGLKDLLNDFFGPSASH